MAAARVERRVRVVRWSLITSMFVWGALSLLPDADVIGFRFGIEYADAWGHRGATHSFAFAIGLGALIGWLAGYFGKPRLRIAVVAALVLISHPLLDILTDGGLGCALFWPFSEQRYFAPWTPIPVAPIGRRFVSSAGLRVALTELAVFFPLLVYALWPRRRV
jgi:inner membrane protein